MVSNFLLSRRGLRSNWIRTMGRSTLSFTNRRSLYLRTISRNSSRHCRRRIMRAGATTKGPGEQQAPSKPAVYLAECSYDRKPQRELLEGELKRLGYPVLPDRRLPGDEVEYVAAVQSLLARCALSIHLVGEKYGSVPDGPTDRSVSMIQNELAVARCRGGGLRRLIWLPQGTELGGRPSAEVHRSTAPGCASSVRRRPDRGRHRGAASRGPRHLEEDRTAGTDATGIWRERGAGGGTGEHEADLLHL